MRASIDYAKLGFKSGIEVHAQLRTAKKLFCNCDAVLQSREPDYTLTRYFRPVLGEMGTFDPALLIEHEKRLTIQYEGFSGSCCTYELDETPPFPINQEALDTCILISLLFSTELVHEIHVCRKMYLDGSVTAGFQRTSLIGHSGNFVLPQSKKKIGISYIYLEEDAGRKSEKTHESLHVYKLDRLGFPLTEIVTEPDLFTADEVTEAAAQLGLILKSSSLVRRGLGTIRQDINVSIAKGARIELKGLQKLEMIKPAIDMEIIRQQELITIQEELLNKKLIEQDFRTEIINLSPIFKETKSKIIKGALEHKEIVTGMKVTKCKGILGHEVQPNRRFGTELSERVKSFTPLKGIIHSDEDLSKYKISSEEIANINKKLGLQSDDAFILILGDDYQTKRALRFVQDRLVSALNGVPEETRKVNSDSTSTFMRDLHGRARLYPDTDSELVVINSDTVEKLKSHIPELPEKLVMRIQSKYQLSENEARILLDNEQTELFELIYTANSNSKLIYTTLTQTLTDLRRNNIPIANLSEKHYVELFDALGKGQFAKEAIPTLLDTWARNPQETLNTILQSVGTVSISTKDLDAIIQKIILENPAYITERGENAFSPLMGKIMKEVRGKIDGKIVNDHLRLAIQQEISKTK